MTDLTNEELMEIRRGLLMRMDLLAKIAGDGNSKQANIANRFGQIATDASNKILAELKDRREADMNDPNWGEHHGLVLKQMHGLGSR